MKEFNLLHEPWIQVRDAGQSRAVGIAEALIQAHTIERLQDPSPLAEVALTRVLLAVLHRALEGPTSEAQLIELYRMGRFPRDRLMAYLELWRDRFWLFHPEAPFWQIGDLPDDAPMPWTKLRTEFACGNNPTLFDHHFDDAPPQASYAEAARALAIHQTFTPGGLIKRLGVSSCKAAPLASGAVFLPLGTNLFETLVQSLALYELEGDQPVWEAEPIGYEELRGDRNKRPKKKVTLAGRTRVYTWVSRGVRLLRDEGGVRHVAYGPGVHALEDGAAPDAMGAYFIDEKTGQLRQVRFRTARAFWRDFNALFPEHGRGVSPQVISSARAVRRAAASARTVPLRVAGQNTDRAKVLEVRRETYPLPLALDQQMLQIYVRNALDHADGSATCLRKGGWVLAAQLLSLVRTPETEDIRGMFDSFPLMAAYWSHLGTSFAQFLELLPRDAHRAAAYWKDEVDQSAREAWKTTVQTVGTQARSLKAVQEAERTWLSCLRRASEKGGD
jgi:CRISPR system Cascade subunit CasA